jgi:hypothetical protein
MFDGPGPVPGETPATIAARVRRGAGHQVAEAALAKAKMRRAEINAEIQTLSARMAGHEGDNDGRLAELDREIKAIRASTHGLREKVSAGRVVHATAVCAALKPLTIAAATRAYQAAVTLQEAVAVLGEVNDQLLRAHGEPYFIPHLDVGPVIARMGRLSGREE